MPRADRQALEAALASARALVASLEAAVAATPDDSDFVTPTPAAARLLDRRGLATMLGVCVDTVDKLRVQGCPELQAGDSPRFEPAEVLAWLRERRERAKPKARRSA